MKPTKTRAEKKSEMLDVRLPHGLKQTLVRICRQNGTTVSKTVRALIENYVEEVEAGNFQPLHKELTMKIIRNPRKTFAMTLTCALSALLFAAQPSIADDALFSAYDKDADGLLTVEELHVDAVKALDRNFDNRVQRNEFQVRTERESAHEQIIKLEDGSEELEISVLITRIDLSDAEEAVVNIWGLNHTLPAETSPSDIGQFKSQMLALMKAHADGAPHGSLSARIPAEEPRWALGLLISVYEDPTHRRAAQSQTGCPARPLR